MPIVHANGIDIAYEDSGPKNGPVVVMVMGLAAQLIAWPPAMMAELNQQGFRTIRFDNRDIGLSQKMDGARIPNVILQSLLAKLHIRGLASYNLTDMAADTVGLMDALGIRSAHLVGLSMGGMISQIVAADFPDRVLSLSAVMTSTNNPKLKGAEPHVAKAMFVPSKREPTKSEAIERTMHILRLIGTPGPDADEVLVRQMIGIAIERSFYPPGPRRQMAAVIDTGDLRPWARRITAPTLVIHGTIDPLVPMDGGVDIAKTVQGATIKLIEGMAHDLPERFLPDITGAMVGHFRSANPGGISHAAGHIQTSDQENRS